MKHIIKFIFGKQIKIYITYIKQTVGKPYLPNSKVYHKGIYKKPQRSYEEFRNIKKYMIKFLKAIRLHKIDDIIGAYSNETFFSKVQFSFWHWKNKFKRNLLPWKRQD